MTLKTGSFNIAVSKRCCYLCELYINFAQKNGYNIVIPGNHKKIYSRWKLSHVNDNYFMIGSLESQGRK